MIEIKFTIDPERNAYEQLKQYIKPFAPIAAAVETEEVVPAKRGRKPKDAVAAKAPVTETVIPEVDDRDAEDETVEAASDVLTHDDVRTAVGSYTKKFGIVAAQKNIPVILGRAVADIPDDQDALAKAIEAIYDAMNGLEQVPDSTALFDDEPEVEITEKDVRNAMMAYAAMYDADTKMVNTLIDGPDILKKTFGPTVTALSLVPKDPASLKKAHDAIVDAIDNNPYNRKRQQ